MEKSWTWVVPRQFHLPERADLAITKAIQEFSNVSPNISRSQIQRLIEKHLITVNGLPIQPKTKLKAGDQVSMHFPAAESLDLTPEEIPLEILYQDDDLLVVNKSQGLSVHPSPTEKRGTLVHALLHHVKNLSGIGGKLRPGIVHRLDKNTSGALVITKTDRAHLNLSNAFSKHEIHRQYLALCYGSPGKSQKIESLIGRNPTDRKKMSMLVKSGKKAVTQIEVLEEFFAPTQKAPFASLVEAHLETGRTHQVRVHLTGIGCSILGDPVYGVPSERSAKWIKLPENIRPLIHALPGQALHAKILGFKHPITRHLMQFEANPPEPFSKLLNALRKYKKK